MCSVRPWKYIQPFKQEHINSNHHHLSLFPQGNFVFNMMSILPMFSNFLYILEHNFAFRFQVLFCLGHPDYKDRLP